MTSQSITTSDREFLNRALELAESGRGRVSPNPLVGAVLVRGGEVIGEGFHAELGGLHAERAALADCRKRGEDPAGATMYLTLEPCAHQGRQPPCVDALIEARVGRVVIASDDPSEKASGRGPGMLRDSGIEVAFAAGEEAAAARLLNQPFRKHARTGLPFVLLKFAMSLDGKTTTPPGQSPWISGELSRALVHGWRSEADAIAVGIGTALVDDPLLTARYPDARQPVRVVFDSEARLPLDSQLLSTLDQSPVLVITAPAADGGRIAALRDAGAEIIVASGSTRSERTVSALADLGRRGITSLFLEGGKTLATSFATAGQIDESRTFIAPVLLGDSTSTPRAGGVAVGVPRGAQEPQAPSIVGDTAATGPAGQSDLVPRLRALDSRSELVGEDILITARYKEW